MTYGLNTGNFANPLLNTVKGTSFVLAGTWIQLHTGDPSAAGTANLSVNTTRNQATFAAAATGTIALSTAPAVWNMTATETIAAISIWSASTGGTVYWTAPLTSSQAVNNGDTLTLNTCSLSIAPLAV
jgi:hypothetical protein